MGKTIMVIDDSETNLILVKSILSNLEKDITMVLENDSRKALAKMRKTLPDLIILDIMMPNIGGLDLLKEVKSDFSLQRIPVIMLSAMNDQITVKQAMDLGANDYLTKPLNPDLLITKVKEVQYESL